jgi:hypothetical protein
MMTKQLSPSRSGQIYSQQQTYRSIALCLWTNNWHDKDSIIYSCVKFKVFLAWPWKMLLDFLFTPVPELVPTFKNKKRLSLHVLYIYYKFYSPWWFEFPKRMHSAKSLVSCRPWDSETQQWTMKITQPSSSVYRSGFRYNERHVLLLQVSKSPNWRELYRS